MVLSSCVWCILLCNSFIVILFLVHLHLFFFFNDTATTEIYTYLHTLSLHDALPISANGYRRQSYRPVPSNGHRRSVRDCASRGAGCRGGRCNRGNRTGHRWFPRGRPRGVLHGSGCICSEAPRACVTVGHTA